MPQEQLEVETQLKVGARIISRERHRMADQVRLLDLESEMVHERFTTNIAERLGETDVREDRHKSVISQYNETVQGTGAQSIYRDQPQDQEIVQFIGQHQLELGQHQLSITLIKQELQQNQETQQAPD